MTLTPGQEVWYVPSFGPSRAVTVGKVGRKWASIVGDRKRIDVANGDVEDPGGYGLSGKVWGTRLAYEEHQYLASEWSTFARQVSTRLPAHMTLETITAARRLLGLEVLP